jgi:hypothetical protein
MTQENPVNCWEPLTVTPRAISSQASRRRLEGSTTNAWSLTETVKRHERGAPYGDEIVWTAWKHAEAKLKRDAVTNRCDTANTGANVVGCCFIRGDTDPNAAGIGGAWARQFAFETQRESTYRSTSVVASARYGVGRIAAESMCKIVTDA